MELWNSQNVSNKSEVIPCHELSNLDNLNNQVTYQSDSSQALSLAYTTEAL